MFLRNKSLIYYTSASSAKELLKRYFEHEKSEWHGSKESYSYDSGFIEIKMLINLILVLLKIWYIKKKIKERKAYADKRSRSTRYL